MLKNKSNIPNFMSYLALNLVRGSLHAQCGHDVLACSPQEAMKWIKTPSFFIIGGKDELVNINKFHKMYQNCISHSKKIVVEPHATHPDSRAEETIEQAFKFFTHQSKLDKSKLKVVSKPKDFTNLLDESSKIN